jgi:hypothetical protein
MFPVILLYQSNEKYSILHSWVKNVKKQAQRSFKKHTTDSSLKQLMFPVVLLYQSRAENISTLLSYAVCVKCETAGTEEF